MKKQIAQLAALDLAALDQIMGGCQTVATPTHKLQMMPTSTIAPHQIFGSAATATSSLSSGWMMADFETVSHATASPPASVGPAVSVSEPVASEADAPAEPEDVPVDQDCATECDDDADAAGACESDDDTEETADDTCGDDDSDADEAQADAPVFQCGTTEAADDGEYTLSHTAELAEPEYILSATAELAEVADAPEIHCGTMTNAADEPDTGPALSPDDADEPDVGPDLSPEVADVIADVVDGIHCGTGAIEPLISAGKAALLSEVKAVFERV